MDDRSRDEPDRALRALDDVHAPPRLRASVEASVADAQRQPGRRRLRAPRPLAALAGATAVVVLGLVLALAFSRSADDGGSGAPLVASPTVPEASRVALADPTAPAPAPRPGGRLDASIAGIDFPDWSRSFGWRAAGERTDELGGRTLRTVVYEDDEGRRFGYAIADGDALPWGGGEVVEREGVDLWVYEQGDATVVAWLRDGRTCILAGRGVDREELELLASSRGA